jgi:hypothetical protein
MADVVLLTVEWQNSGMLCYILCCLSSTSLCFCLLCYLWSIELKASAFCFSSIWLWRTFVSSQVTLWINFQLQVGINFASEILATILVGLHMSETCSRFSLNKETEKHVVNPITCGDCMCPTHNLFGIKFNAQMSCECGKCSGEYPYTALFHKLDAGSPQTTKVCRMQYIFCLAKLG